jgi:hypothetical protein
MVRDDQAAADPARRKETQSFIVERVVFSVKTSERFEKSVFSQI